MGLDPRPQVLAIDDEAPVREALATALAGAYVVHTAATGEDGCDILRTQAIAAILLDAILDGAHGLDFLPRFRALSRAPVIMLTGYGSHELAVRALGAQVEAFLTKPASLETLLATLAPLVRQGLARLDPACVARSILSVPLNPAVDMGTLAAKVGLSERHLRHRFRTQYGETPRQYLLETRMRLALWLIQETPEPLAEIASALGYRTPRHFARQFRRFFQVPPSALRE